jgi:hypothetical protein
MSKEQIVEKYRIAKEAIESNSRLSTVDKDIAVYRKWRNYSNELASLREPALIILKEEKL